MRSPRLHLVTFCVLTGLLPGTAEAQFSGSIEVVGVIRSVQAEERRLTVHITGEDRPVQLTSTAQILDTEGEPLAGGLRAPAVAAGTVVTLTVGAVDGNPMITALRIGRHIPEQVVVKGPSVGLVPLTELPADGEYKGEDGGLYGGGRNQPPEPHLSAARRASEHIRPLDEEGEPSDDGKIGLVSISMSNATMEFSRFKELADRDPRKSERVAIVDCAQGGQAMAQWVDPDAPAWLEMGRRLEAAGLAPQQVQVAWIKLANIWPTGDLTHHGRKLYADTLAVIENARRRFPNLRIAYLGSRIFAGLAVDELNPEPYAYEGAFVVRWLIRDQMKGAEGLGHGHSGGPAEVPLLLWGPYLWADGTKPRKDDGLTWEREDLAEDGVHPTDSGRRKVADLLLGFFTTDPLARTWFTDADKRDQRRRPTPPR